MCISFLASRSANPKDYRAPHRHNGAEAWTGNLELQSGRFAHTPHPMVQGWGAAEKSTRITSGVFASRRFVLSEGKLITNSMNIWVSENCLSYPIRTSTHAQFDLNKSDVPPFTSRLRVVFFYSDNFPLNNRLNILPVVFRFCRRKDSAQRDKQPGHFSLINI